MHILMTWPTECSVLQEMGIESETDRQLLLSEACLFVSGVDFGQQRNTNPIQSFDFKTPTWESDDEQCIPTTSNTPVQSNSEIPSDLDGDARAIDNDENDNPNVCNPSRSSTTGNQTDEKDGLRFHASGQQSTIGLSSEGQGGCAASRPGDSTANKGDSTTALLISISGVSQS